MQPDDFLDPTTLRSIRLLQKQIDTFRRSVEPSGVLSAQMRSVWRPYIEVAERIQKQWGSFTRFGAQFEKQFQPHIDTLRRIQQQSPYASDVMDKLLATSKVYMPWMEQFQQLADRLSTKVEPFTLFRAYEEVLRRYQKASEIPDHFPLEAVVTEVEERVAQAPPGPLSVDFYLNLFLALLLFVWSQSSAQKSEERILERLGDLQTLISETLVRQDDPQDQHTFYVVKRAVNLRVGPSTRTAILVVLYPNLRVRLVERHSKWIKVEYFDYLENVHKSGWVFKKYLKIVNPK